MHDIGRTQLELGELGEYGEFAEVGEYGGYGEYGEYGEVAGTLSEMQELELAAELLEVSGEAELEFFLGKLIGTVGRAAGRFVRSDTGRALGGMLKSAAKQALPMVGRAVGSWISPSGGDIGARVASRAGRLLGLELEGLSPEEQEFEAARQFVRFAGDAALQACYASPGTNPRAAATSAVANAARVYAPGLLPRLQGRSGRSWPRSGRWTRSGRSIVLTGG